MTENALTPQQSFEKKVKDRLRENIGDLMPDEVLQDMIKKAMNEMFFTRRQKASNNWGSQPDPLPSWFEDEVAKQLRERVLHEVRTAVDAKRDEIHTAAVELITKSIPSIIANTIIDLVTGVPVALNIHIQNQILNTLRTKGFQV